MQKVSEDWKYVHQKRLLNESFVKISFNVTDPEAFGDAKSVDNGACYVSNTSEVVNGLTKTIPCYAQLERNIWLLDGSRTFIPNDFGKNMGYISDMLSKADGYFEKIPVVSIKFSKTHNHVIPGITILWGTAYDEYAETFNIKAYNGKDVVASKEIKDNNSRKSIINLDIENYDRIDIEIVKWCLPYHRARITDIFIGVNKTYEKSDLISYDHEMQRDILAHTLPINKMNFAIDNSDNVYDPNNLTGFSKYLMQRQELEVSYGLKLDDGSIEYIPAGVFYLSEWEAPQNGLEARFMTRDVLEFLQKIYTKGLYKKEGTSLYDLAIDVLNEANLPLNRDGRKRWIIDEKLKNIKTTAPLPLCTLAECLQYIASAGACSLYTDRQGILHLKRKALTRSSDYSLTDFNLLERPEIVLQKPVKEISTNVYTYFVDDSEKGKELFNGKVKIKGSDEVVIVYSSSAVNVTATVEGANLESANYYTNACHLKLKGKGEANVKVVGDVLTNSVSHYIEKLDNQGEVQEIDNMLITDNTMAETITLLAAKILSQRKMLKIESWRADPRLDPLDIIDVENKFSKEAVTISNVKYVFTGAFRGSGEGRVNE